MFIRKTLHNKIVRAKEREITELKEEIKELKDVRLLEVRNNTKILEQSDKKTELIKKITELLEINKYNNEKAIIDKIKELVRDYQSKN